jgi:UDP-N-acetylmuramyl pentapeptide phosphotransferase/UDP-N-acetylglucosamine-1-phosphate transferase
MVIGLFIADGLQLISIEYGMVLALLMLASVSLLDDLIGVPAGVRLLVHALAVALPLSLMHGALFAGFAPPWLDKLLTGILWIWFINLFNFMDGIDGISAVELISVGGGIGLISLIDGTFTSPLSVYALMIAVAACGFWWWNRHPAKIFLGDVGSVPLGFFMGYLLLYAAKAGYGFAAVILPAYYLADSGITLISRLWRGKKIWVAHSEHYYQRAVRKGWRHDTVTYWIFGINLLLILLATLAVLNPQLAVVFLAVAYFAVFMLLGFFAHEDMKPEHAPF